MIELARTIQCVPDESKWCSAGIEVVRTSPYDIHESVDPGVVLQDRLVRSGDADQLRNTLQVGRCTSTVKTSESMAIQSTSQDATMRGDMALGEQPRSFRGVSSKDSC